VIQGEGNLREVSIEAVVIRADGTREDLGRVSYWHRNPVKRAIDKLKEKASGNVRR
jgi:hypothetical protein